MRTDPIIYFNGRWVRLKSASISPLDRGFLYGDGIFETLRSYDGLIFRREEHLRRLFSSAEQISLSIPQSADKIESIVGKILERNKIRDGLVRVTCSRGIARFGIDPIRSNHPTLIVMAFPFAPYSESLYKKGLSLALVKTTRNHPGAIPSGVKSANFLNNILAKREATFVGADEGIMLNFRGYLTEGTVSNLFFVHQGTLLTPSLKSGILEGITRNCVIEIAKQNGIPVVQKLFRPIDLEEADECFLTSTGYEIIPATRLNGKRIGAGKPGTITRKLMTLFKSYLFQSLQTLLNRN